jgi:hypothetical protein
MLKNKYRKTKILINVYTILMLTVCNCSINKLNDSKTNAATPITKQELNNKVENIKEKKLPEIPVESYITDPEEIKTWKNFREHEKYRIVRQTDFKIPDWVKKDVMYSMLLRFFEIPSSSGTIKGDPYIFTEAVMVIDKTILNSDRFSIIIFSKNDGNITKLHWFLKDKDLSNMVLSRNSGGLITTEFLENRARICRIKWSKLKKLYFSDEYNR